MPSSPSSPGVQPMRAPIKRNRTGCFTCRRRKKKCDELKPQCNNCQRNGWQCGGYPSPLCPVSSRGQAGGLIETQSESFMSNLVEETQGFAKLFDANLDFLDEENNFLWSNTTEDPIFFETDIDSALQAPANQPFQLTRPSPRNVTWISQGGGSSSRATPRPRDLTPAALPSSAARPQREMIKNSSLNELPFLLDNVNTRTERQLFFHFTTQTSRVLTLSNGKRNPLTSVVVPLASKDQMVMQSLLCLAGSHLAGNDLERKHQDIKLEKHRLHDLAMRAQVLRFRALEHTSGPRSTDEIQAVLTGALLLCLYEICEGSGDETWQIHLQAARKLISLVASQHEKEASSGVTPSQLSELSQFLLEFFVYHDTLAAVTLTSSSPVLPAPTYGLLVQNSNVQDQYMVGVKDGLVDLISRIAKLRSEALESSPDQNGSILCEAVMIWNDLSNWEPQTFDPGQRLINSLYRWALYIWLYCVAHVDGVADVKLQTAVERAIENLQQIQPASGVNACLLFPLFIIGTASIEANHRKVVGTQFQNLRSWSGLGNVKVAHEIVERSWNNYDNSIARSWDWIAQMKMHGVSVLVT